MKKILAASLLAVLSPWCRAQGASEPFRFQGLSEIRKLGVEVSAVEAAPVASAAAPEAEAVQRLAGCFKVTYHYEEPGFETYDISALEYVHFREDQGVYNLQHYGLKPHDNGFDVMKHWGEIWTPAAGGAWKQIVTSPGATKRYECTAPFKTLDFGIVRAYRRICETMNAPKPMRDKFRSDYETLNRRSVVTVGDAGWKDEQQNLKKDESGTYVSSEKGVNSYRRIAASNCEAAVKEALEEEKQ